MQIPNPIKNPACGSNIRITFQLLEETRQIDGDGAECGVFLGATLKCYLYY